MSKIGKKRSLPTEPALGIASAERWCDEKHPARGMQPGRMVVVDYPEKFPWGTHDAAVVGRSGKRGDVAD